jgi:hypothetical protein
MSESHRQVAMTPRVRKKGRMRVLKKDMRRRRKSRVELLNKVLD